MTESDIDVVLDPDATKEGDAAAQRVAAVAATEDRLPTTRLPPITPPPLRTPSVPPGVLGSGAMSPRNTPTVPPQSHPLEATVRFPTDPVRAPKPSWFRSLLTTTSPPPPAAEPHDPGAMRRTVGVGCVAAACAFAAVALVFAFRPPPPLGTMPPVVAATVVIAHALLAIGAGALSYGLLRIAERLWDQKAGRDFVPSGFQG